MIYIYDLILNWNDYKRYDFFEWYDNDGIEYMKKIPIFRISNFDDILDSCIKVNKEFLNRIFKKSEVYGNKKIEIVEYCCVFCDEDLTKSIAIEFNDEGESIYRSNIYFLDSDDVFELAKKIATLKLDYKILYSCRDIDCYLTRKEKEKKKYLINEVNYAYNDKNIDKLKYIYYELFGLEEENGDLMRKKIINSLHNNFNYKHEQIYNLIKTPNFL